MAKRQNNDDSLSLFDDFRERQSCAPPSDKEGAVLEPLAARMRPRTLDEYVGQRHLVGPGRVLRHLLECDRLPSMIFWGPPGTGKTSLARLMATLTKGHFIALSAVTAGVAEVRKVVAEARGRWDLSRVRTVLFLDEIHRFSKSQQDVILPHVEDGTITLVGATTENPSFQVVGPLLSRCRVFTLYSLKPEEVVVLLRRALQDEERGLGRLKITVSDEVLQALASACGGDARASLNGLEEACNSLQPDENGCLVLTHEHVAETLGKNIAHHYRAGEGHYDIISAMIKSIRGSDPDAGLYWLARLLEGGEDPLFIARRLVILASEDVGLADSNGLTVAMAAQQAVHFIGMPEGYYPLAHAVLYLSLAPKSNSVGMSYGRALEAVRSDPGAAVPLHLRNAPTKLMERLGYGKGYKYAHDFPEHYAKQDYLPESLRGQRFYQPGNLGMERRFALWQQHLRGEDQGSGQGEK
ncbi:replication-associated recombination protein A [bacterium]|nr:replication-associated recombination protein A [bacterium]